eukprot:TRINITY_DN3823_c0_g1_i1.p1 TRINITY_DN3823_c0_g1~~TRINITY_DN3823_c0_g1_i1.p1  ORF type:complete len:748 (-),score=199.36 TRINITY_DN3823_c0_g1_i1:112-2052(-)
MALRVHTILEDKPFCLVTDGDWFSSVYMSPDYGTLQRKSVAYCDWPHVNLRAAFASAFHASTLTPDINAIADFLQVAKDPNTGFPALDSCNVVSSVVWQMLKDGNFPTITQSVKIPFLLPDSKQPQSQPQPQSQSQPQPQAQQPVPAAAGTAQQQPPPIVQPAATRQQIEAVVKLRGLPYTATEKDIIEFFHPLAIHQGDGVHIVLNLHGRPSGEAFVEFLSEEDAVKALARHRQHLGRRYVEVFKASRAEMERALESKDPNVTSGMTVLGSLCDPGTDYQSQNILRMRGLPYSATVEDIQEFFRGFDLVPDGIHLICGRDGRSTGDAFAEFTTEEMTLRALTARHKASMGTRYVELFRSSKGELLCMLEQRLGVKAYNVYAAVSALPQAGLDGGDAAGGGSRAEYLCVRMRGLPYSATERDIVQFFDRINVVPGGVHFMYNEQDRPSGDAYVEFASEADVQLAMHKHREEMQNRYIELFRCSKLEMNYAFQQHAQMRSFRPPRAAYAGTGSYAMPPYQAGYASAWPVDPYAGMSRGMPAPQVPVQLFPMQVAPLDPMRQMMQQYVQAGCALRMRGLPYSATANDVIYFFSGYDVVRSLIEFGTLPDGRSNGECLVAFSSQYEAARAMRECNNGHMGSRYIELFPA